VSVCRETAAPRLPEAVWLGLDDPEEVAVGDIVITEFITLDGIIDTPAWTVPYQHDEIEAHKKDELFASDAQLLGRTTYEMFAASWPGATDEQGFADRMNRMPKYVVSSTVTEPTPRSFREPPTPDSATAPTGWSR
jgi:hypothetical protein